MSSHLIILNYGGIPSGQDIRHGRRWKGHGHPCEDQIRLHFSQNGCSHSCQDHSHLCRGQNGRSSSGPVTSLGVRMSHLPRRGQNGHYLSIKIRVMLRCIIDVVGFLKSL